MFIHIFKTRIKCLLREKPNMFWILLFPIILATFFSFAYSDLFILEDLTTIEVAVVEHDNIALEQMLNASKQGDEPLLNITYVNDEEATKLLADGTVEGVITVAGENVRLTVSSMGINQTVLKNLLDSFAQTNAAIHAMIEDNPTILQSDFLWETRHSYIDEELIDAEKADPFVYLYHALLAMACLFGGYFGIRCIAETQPNQSAKGVRRSIAPIHKLHIFAYEFLATLLVHIILMFIVLAYILLILDIDFGTKIPAIMLALAVSSLLGVSIGVFFGTLVSKSEKVSSAIFNIGSMTSCILAGFIGGYEIKYILESNMPFLKYINPATLISDSFYNLYVFDTYDRFVSIILLMLSMASICIIGACFIIRRQKYASI